MSSGCGHLVGRPCSLIISLFQYYVKALGSADGRMEFASAAKNYALASWRLGDVYAENCQVVDMHVQYKLSIEVSLYPAPTFPV